MDHSANITFAEPRIHAFVYEPTTGIAKKLPVDFDHYINQFHGVYNLYTAE